MELSAKKLPEIINKADSFPPGEKNLSRSSWAGAGNSYKENYFQAFSVVF